MVNKRSMSGMVAACSVFLAFPALSSAHTLSVTAGPSQCVTPLNGSYTATVTVTEKYFSGTVENIPVGINVHELSSSTDKGNTGYNQNYFTTSTVGTQTGKADFGQPTSFTSPSNGSTATQQFTVTATGTETYVLGNSYMRSPSSVTIDPPSSACTPPTSCPSGQVLSGGQCVPPTTCPAGETLSAGVCSVPKVVPAPKTFPGVCRATTRGYKVRAGQQDTIIVSVARHGAAVSGANVRITIPGNKSITHTTGRNGKATFVVEPAQSGTIFVRSPSCKETVKVKVYAAKAATALRAPSFTG